MVSKYDKILLLFVMHLYIFMYLISGSMPLIILSTGIFSEKRAQIM